MVAKHRKQKRTELPGSRVTLHFKRHMLPPLVGLGVAILVLGFFDAQLISSKIAHYEQSRRPEITTDAQTSKTVVSKDTPSRLIINSVNVNVAVIFEHQDNENVFLNDLQSGVVHYPNTAVPGREGNIVIFGQSGDRWWAPGKYKFVFTLLDRLKIGDKIFLNYQGTLYTYKVYDSAVAAPTDLTSLNQSSSHILTLVTATPAGTNTNRLVIRASQTVPSVGNDFTSDKAATLPAGALNSLPGASPSFWHELHQRF